MFDLKFGILTRNGCGGIRNIVKIFKITEYHMIRGITLCIPNSCNLPHNILGRLFHSFRLTL